MFEIQPRAQPEQHVGVRHAEIRVEQHRATAEAGERGTEIHGRQRLADTAFAARDRNDLRVAPCAETP